jgi:hypothetical protein
MPARSQSLIDAQKRYYEANKKKYREAQVRYRETVREEYDEYQRKYKRDKYYWLKYLDNCSYNQERILYLNILIPDSDN